METEVVLTYQLQWIMLQWTGQCKYLFQVLMFIIEWPSRIWMAWSCRISNFEGGGTYILFSMGQYNFIFLSRVCKGSLSAHTHQHLTCFTFLFVLSVSCPARGEVTSYWDFDLEFLMTRGLLVSLWIDSFISGSALLSFSPFDSFFWFPSLTLSYLYDSEICSPFPISI